MNLSSLVSTSVIPTGAVMSFAMNSAPSGWLICNGASLSRSVYPALFSAIGIIYGALDGATFNLPDLRGLFVRGFDASRGLDEAGRAFGVYQDDAYKSHGHTFNDYYQSTGGVSTAYEKIQSSSDNFRTYANGGGGDTGHTTPNSVVANGGTETRPKNIAMLYCIKI